MAGENGKIRAGLKRLIAEATGQIYGIIGTVTAIDKGERTCTVTPITGEADVQDVNLQANTSLDNGIVTFPVLDSEVIVSFLSDENAYISLFSEIDEIRINNGENGGLINISDLVGKLNTVENDLNDLKTVLAAWVPVTQDGGTALKAALGTYYTEFIVPTQEAELEDTNVLH